MYCFFGFDTDDYMNRLYATAQPDGRIEDGQQLMEKYDRIDLLQKSGIPFILAVLEDNKPT